MVLPVRAGWAWVWEAASAPRIASHPFTTRQTYYTTPWPRSRSASRCRAQCGYLCRLLASRLRARHFPAVTVHARRGVAIIVLLAMTTLGPMQDFEIFSVKAGPRSTKADISRLVSIHLYNPQSVGRRCARLFVPKRSYTK